MSKVGINPSAANNNGYGIPVKRARRITTTPTPQASKIIERLIKGLHGFILLPYPHVVNLEHQVLDIYLIREHFFRFQ
jgi:hypothetical protein